MDANHAALQRALLQAPEYMGLPKPKRIACHKFLTLIQDSNVTDIELEGLYEEALNEARALADQGALTISLAGETASEQPPAPSTQKLAIHPAAEMFPMMRDDELNELATDIKANGQREPVVMHGGQVIDGRNRLRACEIAGVEPKFTQWSGTGSVVAWILSANLHRRHLTDTQRAMVAGRVAEALAAEGRERSAQNLRKTWDLVDVSNRAHPDEGRSADKAASMLNVSTAATKKATKVLKTGHKKLVQAVTEGNVSLDAAAQVATLPKERQRKLVESGEVKEAAKKIRREKASAKEKVEQPSTTDHAQSPSPEPTMQAFPAQPEPEPITTTASPSEPNQEDDTPRPVHSANEDLPVVREAHEALDAMVFAARCANRLDQVTKSLQNLTQRLVEMTARYENEAMP